MYSKEWMDGQDIQPNDIQRYSYTYYALQTKAVCTHIWITETAVFCRLQTQTKFLKRVLPLDLFASWLAHSSSVPTWGSRGGYRNSLRAGICICNYLAGAANVIGRHHLILGEAPSCMLAFIIKKDHLVPPTCFW